MVSVALPARPMAIGLLMLEFTVPTTTEPPCDTVMLAVPPLLPSSRPLSPRLSSDPAPVTTRVPDEAASVPEAPLPAVPPPPVPTFRSCTNERLVPDASAHVPLLENQSTPAVPLPLIAPPTPLLKVVRSPGPGTKVPRFQFVAVPTLAP